MKEQRRDSVVTEGTKEARQLPQEREQAETNVIQSNNVLILDSSILITSIFRIAYKSNRATNKMT